MKKTRKYNLEKLNSIVQSNYVVMDLTSYNQMIRYNTLTSDKINKIYNIIYENTYSETVKYRKIKQLLLKGEELWLFIFY